jgi:hypothetical protein
MCREGTHAIMSSRMQPHHSYVFSHTTVSSSKRRRYRRLNLALPLNCDLPFPPRANLAFCCLVGPDGGFCTAPLFPPPACMHLGYASSLTLAHFIVPGTLPSSAPGTMKKARGGTGLCDQH